LQEFDSAGGAPSWNLQVRRPAAIGQIFSTELSRTRLCQCKKISALQQIEAIFDVVLRISHRTCAAITCWPSPGQADIKMEQ
jgi:hypothetical protein